MVNFKVCSSMAVAVNALMVVDILVVLEGIPVAHFVEMTAVVPRINCNNAAVALRM